MGGALGLAAMEAGLFSLLFSNTRPGQTLNIFYELIWRYDTYALIPFAALLIAALALSGRAARALELADWSARHPRVLAALALVVYCVGAVFVYHLQPLLTMDEFAPVFQSKAFAAGSLHGTVPPDLVDAIVYRSSNTASPSHFLVVNGTTGAIASNYWPAFALIQAPFALFALNWLVNPLLGAGSLLVLDSLVRRLGFDDRERGLVLLATAAAAAIAINAMSFYAMPLLLFCNLLFTRLVIERSAAALAGAGLFGSIALTAINPVPHTLYALPWILWLMFRPGGGVRAVGWLAAGYLPLSLILGIGWPVVLHGLSQGKIIDGTSGADASGYVSVFTLPTFKIFTARVLAFAKLDLWAVPGLVPLAVLGTFVWKAPVARCLAASALLTWVGYLFVPFTQGHGWGYRYFHQAWFVLPILAVGGLAHLAASEGLARRAYGFLALSCVGSALLLVPLRMVQVEGFVRAHLEQLPRRAPTDARQLVFVDAECGYYITSLIQNDPFLRGSELRFASMGGARNHEIATRFIDNPVVVGRTPCAERWGPGRPSRKDDQVGQPQQPVDLPGTQTAIVNK